MHSFYKSNNGFTLIEVLIAITVFSVGLLGITSLTIGIIKGNKFSNNLATATTLAQDRMEEIVGAGYTSASGKDEAYGNIADYPPYRRTTVIDNNKPSMDMKTVTVTVYWNSDTHSVVSKTILSK